MAFVNLLSPSSSQRLLGITAGATVALLTYTATQRLVWQNASLVCKEYGMVIEPREQEDVAVWGPQTRAVLVQTWNKTIDNTVGSLAAELARRGW